MFAPDKLKHFAAGLMVALFVIVAWLALGALVGVPMAALPYVLIVASLVAGVVKEACDYLDNRALAAVGSPPMHTVETLDVFATFLPGLICAVLIHLFGLPF